MRNFQSISKEKIIYTDECFFIIEDSYPVTKGHLLIISNEVRKDYFELSKYEKDNLPKAIEKAKLLIEENHSPDGYNIGMNCGKYAGQTVFHFHCHIIPRYKGDIDNPAGGVRGVIPNKMKY